MAQASKVPQTRPPIRRMLSIHEQLKNGKYPNCTKLSVEFELKATRTILRDIEFMRDQLACSPTTGAGALIASCDEGYPRGNRRQLGEARIATGTVPAVPEKGVARRFGVAHIRTASGGEMAEWFKAHAWRA